MVCCPPAGVNWLLGLGVEESFFLRNLENIFLSPPECPIVMKEDFEKGGPGVAKLQVPKRVLAGNSEV